VWEESVNALPKIVALFRFPLTGKVNRDKITRRVPQGLPPVTLFRRKKNHVVPVSYREKIRVGRSEMTTDAILARRMSSPQPPGENRVARSIALKK
jgi:hypothetical protein